MNALSSLSLRQCTVVPPHDLPNNPLRSGAALTPDNVRWHVPLLRALPALRSVELVAMPYLRDHDFEGIGGLTQLTTLLVCASGTIEVRVCVGGCGWVWVGGWVGGWMVC